MTNLNEIVEMWRTYSENIYSDVKFQAPLLNYKREPDTLSSEVEHAVRKSKTGKATGSDALSDETLIAYIF